MIWPPCGLLLRSAAGTRRRSGAADWLKAIVAAALAERHTEPMAGTRDLALIDGTAISQPGSNSTDRVLPCRYKRGQGFSGFALTDRSSATRLSARAQVSA